MSIGRWLPAHRRDFHSSLCSAWVLQFAVSAFRSVSAAFPLAFVRRGFYDAKLDDAASQSHPFHSSLCSAWVLQYGNADCRQRHRGAFTLAFVRRGFYNAVSGAVDIGNFAFTLAFVRRGFYNPVRAGRSTTCSTAFTLAF